MDNIPKLKLRIEGRELQALYAISSEFKGCGKASKIGLSINRKEQQNFKFNDADFLCVYASINRVLNGHRYPAKEGHEYLALCKLKSYFEEEYIKQRNHEIPNL
jgi:hypothetical protein